MDVGPAFRIIRSRLRVVVAITVLGALVAFGFSYLLSPQYSATAHVLVRASSSGVLDSTGQTVGQQPTVLDSSLTTSLAETDSGIVTSRAMAERVVDELHLDKKKADESIFQRLRDWMKTAYNFVKSFLIYGMYKQPGARDGAVDQTQRSLQAAQLKDSYIVEIKASASDADLASALANQAAKDLVTMSKERYQADAARYRDFLKGQVDAAQKTAADSQAKLDQFKSDNNITDINEALKLSADNQQQLEQQLQDTNVALSAAQAQYASLVTARDAEAQTNATSSTVTTGRSSTTVSNTSSNPVYSDLATQAAEEQAQVASLQAKHDALVALLAPTTNQLPAQEAQLKQLELQVTAANANYDQLKKSYDQQVLDAAGANLEVSQLDTAGVPLYPDRPLRYLFLLAGALIGFAGGAGLAAWFERPRRVKLEELAAEPAAVPGHVLQPAFSVPVKQARSASLGNQRRPRS